MSIQTAAPTITLQKPLKHEADLHSVNTLTRKYVTERCVGEVDKTSVFRDYVRFKKFEALNLKTLEKILCGVDRRWCHK